MKLPLLFAALSVALVSASAQEPDITKIRIKEVPEKQFFCAKKQLKIADVGGFATATLPMLVEKAVQLKLAQNGPIVLSYIGFKGDPEEPFTLEADFPVHAADNDYRGDFYFRALPKFKCASVIFQGPVAGMGAAWGKLVEQAIAAGHQPNGESREVFLSWESPESQNNIIELQFGIQ